MAKKNKENFLDYIPKHNSLYEYKKNEQGNVEIHVLNRGLYNRIAQFLFHRPEYSDIELTGMGTFIWEAMDGEKNVFEIGKCVKEEFGEEAEPLYERLCTYIKNLHNLGYIVYVNKIPERKN